MVRGMDADGPNAEQITYWNDTAGPKWVAFEELLDTQIRPLGEAAMDRAGIHEGDRVLDVGCGTGQTSIELARRVGARGAVTAVDISAPMLARARARAAGAGGATSATSTNASITSTTASPSTTSRTTTAFAERRCDVVTSA